MNKDIIELDGVGLEVINHLDVIHSFSKGNYARSGTMRANSIIVGHIHKEEHLNILSSGSMILWMDGVISKIDAPAIFTAPENSRKILYTITDCVFTNIHHSFKTDLQELEDELIDKKPVELDLNKIAKMLLDKNKELLCG